MEIKTIDPDRVTTNRCEHCDRPFRKNYGDGPDIKIKFMNVFHFSREGEDWKYSSVFNESYCEICLPFEEDRYHEEDSPTVEVGGIGDLVQVVETLDSTIKDGLGDFHDEFVKNSKRRSRERKEGKKK